MRAVLALVAPGAQVHRRAFFQAASRAPVRPSGRRRPGNAQQGRQMVTRATAAAAPAPCAGSAYRGLQSLVERSEAPSPVPVEVVAKSGAQAWLDAQPRSVGAWASALDWKVGDGEVLLVPAAEGGVERVVLGAEDPTELWTYAALRSKLPPGQYQLAAAPDANAAALGWLLGAYTYDRFKSKKEGAEAASAGAARVQLVWPEGADQAAVSALAEGIFLARDLVTTPAEDLGPQHLAAEALAVAAAHGASGSVIVGGELLEAGYPAIHTVGRASANEPRLVDFRWAPPGSDPASLPRVTLVGKGVCFDTGGLDIKPAAAMKLMKKDMGGAALVLGLAHAVMKTRLPVNLRVLIPAVENSISGNAFRPLDVLRTRAGITVENGNTDAEGRLILCDALADAVSEAPELLVDAATLTGAARVALGTELPALFCNNDEVASGLLAAGEAMRDPLWRLPLHKPYRKMLDSKIADINSCGEGGYAGAITAALFLQEFVKDCPAWVHIDTMGYNLATKPGRPEGGEAFGLRALYEYLRRRYAGGQ